MKYKFIIFIFLFPVSVFATPSIKSILWSGNLTNGTTITLVMTGAGTKARALPIVYADFENGSVNPSSIYSTSTTWASTNHAQIVSTNCYNNTNGCAGEVVGWESGRIVSLEIIHEDVGYSGKCYSSWKEESNAVDFTTDNWKTWRHWIQVGLKPDAYIATQVDDSFGFLTENTEGISITGENRFFFTPKILPSSTNYDTFEVYEQFNSGNNNQDGSVSVYKNGVVVSTGLVNRWLSDTPLSPGRFKDFFFQLAQTAGGSGSPPPIAPKFVRYDDCVMDTSWAHVILSTNSTLAVSGLVHYAPATSWADTSITAVVPQEGFTNGQLVYAYVVDGNNVVSSGYPLTVGATFIGFPFRIQMQAITAKGVTF